MTSPDHDCWWTRRRECELSRRGSHLIGAGLSRSVLETAARHLGSPLVFTAIEDEPDDESFTLGPWTGNLHDRCMLQVEPYDARLTEALIVGAVALHGHYLGSPPAPSVVARVVDCLGDETTVRLRSIPERGQLVMRCHPADAGWWSRLTTPVVRLP